MINTISHADHVYGSCFFPEAKLIAHEKCRVMLEEYGVVALAEAKENTPQLREVEIRLPKMVFDEGMLVRLGGKTVHAISSPGPSPEVCVVHVREEKVLFASDLMMPVPLIATPFSDLPAYKESLRNLASYNLETIVQGHGDILLRGEVDSSIEDSIRYLDDIEALVNRLIGEARPSTIWRSTTSSSWPQPHPAWRHRQAISPVQPALPVEPGPRTPASGTAGGARQRRVIG